MPQNIDYSAYTMYQLYTKPIFGVESYLQEEEYQIHCLASLFGGLLRVCIFACIEHLN